MDTNNQQFDPTSLGAKPVQGAFDPTSIGAKPYQNGTDVNNSAAVLGITNSINENSMKAEAQNQLTQQGSPLTPEAMDQATPEQLSKVADLGGQAENAKKQATVGVQAAKVLFDPAIKFLGSAVRSPIDIVRSLFGKSPLSGKIGLPSGGETQSIQSDFAQSTVPKVVSGEISPLVATAGVVGETAGGAADVLGAAGAIKAGTKLAQPLGDVLAKKTLASAEQSALKKTVDIVSPKLTAKETAQAIAEGRGKPAGIFSKAKINPDQRLRDVAEATKGIVKGKDPIEDVNNVRSALSKEAESLSGKVKNVKQAVSDKGVKTWLDNVEKPIEIKADPTQNRKFDITKNALLKLVDRNEKNVSGMLKARKEFDALVQREFPNIYDRVNAPFRTSVTSMRNALNDAIESNLPDGFGYKESLKKQSLMYDAIDNISSKSVDQIGKTSIQQKIGGFVKKHPYITGALGGTAVERIVKKTTGLGP